MLKLWRCCLLPGKLALIITTFLLTLARLEITEKDEIYKYTNPKNKLVLICAKLSKA